VAQPQKYVEVWREGNDIVRVSAAWMKCPNTDCLELMVALERTAGSIDLPKKGPIVGDLRLVWREADRWMAIPRKAIPKPLDPAIPVEFRRNYVEATRILEDSPRMSAVLSRRTLEDVLLRYGKYAHRGLSDRVKAFLDDNAHPISLRENLDYLREIADFGAHSQADQQTGEIVEVETDEAKWLLDVLERLFDYFIVAPGRDAMLRAGIAQKSQRVGRRPPKNP
jgi:hypothetical protein